MLNSNYQEQAKKILYEWKYQVRRKIGKGGFGLVFLANKFSNSAGIYAVKCFSLKNNAKNPNFKKYIEQQVKAMCTVEHQNVVRFETSFQDSGWYFIVMEYCDMGNLLNYQSKSSNKILGLSQASKIMMQILQGVETIHKKKIIHRDIKCENIFLKKNKTGNGFRCKIGDFGFAKQIQQITKTSCGTTLFMAPQVFRKIPYGFQADIWSVGVVFYFMIFGQYPFKSINIEKEIFDKCVNGFTIYDAPQHMKDRKQFIYIEDLFRRIFDLDQSRRIKLQDIKNHKLFKSEERQATDDSFSQDPLQQQLDLCIGKINFIQELLLDLTKLKILEPYLYSASRFYLFKILLYIINQQNVTFYRTQQPNHQFNIYLKNKQEQIWTYLLKQYQILTHFSKETKKINKFQQGFNLQVQNFYDIKEGYRSTISAVYSEIQKKIPNQSFKLQLKLRVLCCHLINRVFVKGFQKQIFPNFTSWFTKKEKKQSKKAPQFNKFKQWIKEECNQRLTNQIQNINKKFYC